MKKAGLRFSARLIESRDRKMSHQNAIREGSQIRPALNAAHGGGFRVPRKRSDVIDSKWSGREDLNLRPPGPEPVFQSFENREGWKRFGIIKSRPYSPTNLGEANVPTPQGRVHG